MGSRNINAVIILPGVHCYDKIAWHRWRTQCNVHVCSLLQNLWAQRGEYARLPYRGPLFILCETLYARVDSRSTDSLLTDPRLADTRLTERHLTDSRCLHSSSRWMRPTTAKQTRSCAKLQRRNECACGRSPMFTYFIHRLISR